MMYGIQGVYCSGTAYGNLSSADTFAAGVALLVAPKSGEETRRMIRELAEDTKAKAEDWIEEVKDKASGFVILR